MPDIDAVDLFCGVGGLTCGVKKAGINVVAGYDIDGSSKFAYERNNGSRFILKDIKDLDDNEVAKLYPRRGIKVLMGCAPCQPFSSYNRMPREAKSRVEKMGLLAYFGKQVLNVNPDIVSMENVPQLAKESVFEDFTDLLKSAGYHVSWQVVYAPKYGVPQNRKRLILLASKLGEIQLLPPEFDDPKLYPTVRDAIGSLPPINAGEICPSDNLHRARKLSDINLKRIRNSIPGGTWMDWEESLRPAAYKKASGATYKSVYGRLSWDKPSSTITTQFIGYGSGRFGHPEQDRALSLREGALLQTFPLDYKFIDPTLREYAVQPIAVQIGNAVPVKLGEVIGKSIVKHVYKVGA